MKNRLIISVILGLILSSCGTTTRYASSSFEDAIYQRSSQSSYIVVNTEADLELSELRGKTQESNRVILNGRVIEPAYVDEQGNVEIEAKPDVTYVILNPGESFEDRLTKFDQPYYNININFNTLDFFNPWFIDYRYSRYAYMTRGQRAYWRWYYPYYSWSYWYSPWPSHYPWYTGWPGYYSSMWYGPWDYYYGYMPGGYHWPYSHYYGYWHPSNYPSYIHHPGRSGRDRFYGRRESARFDSPSTTNHSPAASNSGGSYIRRDARVSQVRGESVYNGSQNLEQRYSESVYRRDSRVERPAASGDVASTTRTDRTSRTVNTQTRDVSRTSPARSEATQSQTQRTSEVRRTTAPNTNFRQSERARTIESQASQRSSGVSGRNESSFERGNTTRSTSATRSNTYSPPPARNNTTSTSSSSSSASSTSSSSSRSSSSGNTSSGYRR